MDETSLSPAAHLTFVASPARRDRRDRARLLGRGCETHRGAARRHAGYERYLHTAWPRLCLDAGADRRYPPHRRFRCQRIVFIPSATRIPRHAITILALLRRKIDAGASRAIAQFCFDSEAVARMRDRAGGAGHLRAHHPPA
ncbi:MAG: hypothetical protein WDM89_05540 [Rhizomicrobium sp.]